MNLISARIADMLLKGHTIVIAPHEGLVSAEIWLTCRKRILPQYGVSRPAQGQAYMACREGEMRQVRRG